MLANVIQMKYEHMIHMKAKSERLIYRRRSLNVSTTVLALMMQMKSEHLIHMKAKSERLVAVPANVIQMKSKHLIRLKAKSERLICKRQSLNV